MGRDQRFHGDCRETWLGALYEPSCISVATTRRQLAGVGLSYCSQNGEFEAAPHYNLNHNIESFSLSLSLSLSHYLCISMHTHTLISFLREAIIALTQPEFQKLAHIGSGQYFW